MENFYQTKQARSLEEALKICLSLRERGFWSFRGQRKGEWHVGLHNCDPTKLDDYRKQFFRRCMEFPPPDHIGEEQAWRWLFFAQHHRLKTQLLDWTKDPLVAIYFAVENILSGGNDEADLGAIWAVKVADKHFFPADEIERKRPKSLSQWIMINPNAVIPRQVRQSSVFSFHPTKRAIFNLDQMKRRSDAEELVKIELCRGADGKNPSAAIRKQLGILNVHHASLFPGPDGVAQFVCHEWDTLQLFKSGGKGPERQVA